ncbi:hypothetical protein NBRC116584_28060 [Hydrogenophaga sp. 5NK40-0174]
MSDRIVAIGNHLVAAGRTTVLAMIGGETTALAAVSIAATGAMTGEEMRLAVIDHPEIPIFVTDHAAAKVLRAAHAQTAQTALSAGTGGAETIAAMGGRAMTEAVTGAIVGSVPHASTDPNGQMRLGALTAMTAGDGSSGTMTASTVEIGLAGRPAGAMPTTVGTARTVQPGHAGIRAAMAIGRPVPAAHVQTLGKGSLLVRAMGRARAFA